ncbi:MAG: hypothetical protein ACRECT_03010 [Thermoplasmata archaeon]
MSGPSLGFRSVLRNRQYLYFLGSSNAASVGYSVYAISVVWLAYTVSHSYFVVGLVLFVEYATYAATFLIGPFVDRVGNQRTIYLICYPIQAVAAATIGVADVRGVLTTPLLVGLIVLISALWDLAWAAYNAAPGILLSPAEQFAASGVSGAIGGANTIAGYAAGGVLILVVGADGGMFLYAALLAVGAILAVRLSIRPGPPREVGLADSFREGWRTLSAGPGSPLLQLASVDAVQGFFMSGTALFITLTSVSVFAASGGAYGVLFTVYVVGGVAAGLLLGRFNPRGRAGAVLVGALLATGAGFALSVSVPAVLVVLALVWFLIGLFLSMYGDAKYAFLRGSVDPQRLGRVTANLYLFPGITSAVGALVLGDLANTTSPLDFGLLLGVGFLAAGLLAVVLPGVKVLRY